jgi:hypothetical protein
MKRFFKYIGILFVIGILVGVAVFLFVFRKSSDNIANETPAFKVSCTQLVSEFESNEQVANTKYLDKVIEVSGTIAELNSDTSGVNITLRDENATSGVTCSFGISQKINIKELKLGSPLTCKGICTGFLMDVTLIKGALVK